MTPCGTKIVVPIQGSQKYDRNLKPISKKAHTVLRHEPRLRAMDGAAYCPTLTQILYDPSPKHDLVFSTSGWKRNQMHQT